MFCDLSFKLSVNLILALQNSHSFLFRICYLFISYFSLLHLFVLPLSGDSPTVPFYGLKKKKILPSYFYFPRILYCFLKTHVTTSCCFTNIQTYFYVLPLQEYTWKFVIFLLHHDLTPLFPLLVVYTGHCFPCKSYSAKVWGFLIVYSHSRWKHWKAQWMFSAEGESMDWWSSQLRENMEMPKVSPWSFLSLEWINFIRKKLCKILTVL